MTKEEAKMWIDGFTSGAVFFASTEGSFREHHEAMMKIKQELYEAQRVAADE